MMTFDVTQRGNSKEVTESRNYIGEGIVRGVMYGCAPLYIALRNKDNTWNSLGLDAKVIAIAYFPQLVILSAPALEGVVRSIIHLCKTHFTNSNQKEWHRKAAQVEFGAAHRIMRAAFLPVIGYIFVAVEVGKFATNDLAGRSLIGEYYTGRIPYEAGRLTTEYVIVPTSEYIIKPVWHNGCWVANRTAHLGYNALDYVGFWTGVKVTTTWAGTIIATSLGYAKNLIGRG